MGLGKYMRGDALIHLQGDNHGKLKRKHSAKHLNAKHATNTSHASAKASHTLYRA